MLVYLYYREYCIVFNEIFTYYYVEDVNSWMRGTHEFHENWATTNTNDSTVYRSRSCFYHLMPGDFHTVYRLVEQYWLSSIALQHKCQHSHRACSMPRVFVGRDADQNPVWWGKMYKSMSACMYCSRCHSQGKSQQG